MPTRTRKSGFLAPAGEQKIGKRALRREEEEEKKQEERKKKLVETLKKNAQRGKDG